MSATSLDLSCQSLTGNSTGRGTDDVIRGRPSGASVMLILRQRVTAPRYRLHV